MLTVGDRELVERELLILVTPYGAPRTALLAVVPLRIATQVEEGLPTRVLVPRVIDLCIADAYTSRPPVLADLLTKMIGTIEGVPAIIAKLMNPPPPAPVPSPFGAIVLDNKLPFLARTKVRAYLEALTTKNPTQTIVVVESSGPPGKSYTREFVDYLRRAIGVRHCYIEVPKGQGPSIGPLQLSRDLLTQLGGNPKEAEESTTDLDRWTQDLCNTIIAAATRNNREWWFILDGFNARELRPDTQRFITKFATALTAGTAQELHRLILIDFDRTILPLKPGMIAVDKTEAIAHADIEPAVRSLVQASSKGVDPLPYVQRVVRDLPNPVDDLTELGERFRVLAEILS